MNDQEQVQSVREMTEMELQRLRDMLELIDAENVQRVIVTRGNLTAEHLFEVTTLLEVDGFPPSIWNNAIAPFDAKVFGRFLVHPRLDGGLLYVQDDDCKVPRWADLIEEWRPGKIVCNMPEEFRAAYAPRRSRIIGFGAVFESTLIRKTFDRYLKYFPMDDLFLMEADRIFTGLNTERCIMVDVGHENMSYASDKDRMWKQPDHRSRFEEAERRIAEILEHEAKEGNPDATN